MKGCIEMSQEADTKKETFHYLAQKEFKSIDAFLDYFEALLGTPTFPRNMMTKATHGQVLVSSRKSFLEKLEEAQFQDCFIATHSELDKMEYRLRMIFLDFDNEENIALAISDALHTAQQIEKDFGIKPHVQFSGFKGAHVLLPIEHIEFESLQEEK
jgi:hypothetical protein